MKFSGIYWEIYWERIFSSAQSFNSVFGGKGGWLGGNSEGYGRKVGFLGLRAEDTGQQLPTHCAPKRTCTGVLRERDVLWTLDLVNHCSKMVARGQKTFPSRFYSPSSSWNLRGPVAPGAEQGWVLATRQGRSTSCPPGWPEILHRWLLDTPPSCEGR